MSQAEFRKLIPALRIAIRPRSLRMRNIDGPGGRLKRIAGHVTNLIRDERVEHNFPTLSEARNYAERLIAEAIRHGDKHQPTMDLANFYLQEKQLVHKLFKVLVPRYRNSTVSYTKMYKAPTITNRKPAAIDHPKGILELRNNPLPPLEPRPIPTRNWIHNVLLEEARKDFAAEKKMEKELALQNQIEDQQRDQNDEID
uniref:Large ribosomal subunit protein bL17m n=2 Tax=Hirondellea gigas TaxID=1518452 RepID=A0A6A7FQQ0_9CRUS